METAMPAGRGKYRIRTWMRGRVPGRLSALFPKGSDDCARHEWYRSDETTWRCYHCEVGVTERSPWGPIDGADISLTALKSLDASQGRRPLSEAEERLRLALAGDLTAIARALRSGGATRTSAR